MKKMRLLACLCFLNLVVSATLLMAGVDELKVIDPLEPIYSAEGVRATQGGKVLRLVGPRNGACSAQVVALGSGLDQVRASLSALKGPGGEIPADAVVIRYAGKEDEVTFRKLVTPNDDTVHEYLDAYYDILFATPPVDTGVLPVWVTVEIPSATEPGVYTGSLKVADRTVPVSLTVSPWQIPAPAQFETHVGLGMSHESLALYYEKEPWSEEHWALIEQQMQLLGRLGNDDLWVHALWGHGYNKGNSALLRFKTEAGAVVPDFSLIDRYFQLYKKYCQSPEFIIVNLWAGNPRGRSGRPPEHVNDVVLDGQKGDIPRVYAPGGAEIWKAALDGVRERATAMGWEADNVILGLASDQHPSEQEMEAFKQIGPYGKWAIWTHGRGEERHWDVKPGEKFIYSDGMEVAYYAHPFTPTAFGKGDPDGDGRLGPVYVEDGIQGGWNMHVNSFTTTRNDIHQYAALTQWRGYAAGTSVGGKGSHHESKGFAFIWFDWFQLPDSGHPPFFNRTSNVMSRNNSPALVAPGPDGPVVTVRYEMFREGIQENEARIAVERALFKGNVAKDKDEQARAFLQKMVNIRFKDGKFDGGHAGSNIGKEERMWGRAPYPQWLDDTRTLYNWAYGISEAGQ